ncbi:hypothetical protein I79_018376 [Cricetulus griseus]|uniref:Uncharacterized protein n=1 Tax=Cricetulus griseus TaxID=10029 RepID=G3I4J6_CRIGR|nr:hypothetical protein I79_018376 [Cricetulus griseus]
MKAPVFPVVPVSLTLPVPALLSPTISTHQYCSQPSPKGHILHTNHTSEWTQQVPGLLGTRKSHLCPKEK